MRSELSLCSSSSSCSFRFFYRGSFAVPILRPRQRVKDELRQFLVQLTIPASKGRAENRIERQHRPSNQIRFNYKRFADSACATLCKLGEESDNSDGITAKAIFLYLQSGRSNSGLHFQKESREHAFLLILRSDLRRGHRWISWLRAAAAADMGSQSDNQVHRRKIKLNTIILNSFLIISACS